VIPEKAPSHEQGWTHYDEPNLMISNSNLI
jgi:hypothetical protein